MAALIYFSAKTEALFFKAGLLACGSTGVFPLPEGFLAISDGERPSPLTVAGPLSIGGLGLARDSLFSVFLNGTLKLEREV